MECTFGPSITCNLIVHVLTICHMKLMQSIGLEEKHFDLWSLSPTLRNLWLLLVIYINLYFLRKARLQEEQFWSQDSLALEKQLLLWVKWSLSLSLMKLLLSNLQNADVVVFFTIIVKKTTTSKHWYRFISFTTKTDQRKKIPKKKIHLINTYNEKYALQKVCESSFIWMVTGFHLQI